MAQNEYNRFTRLETTVDDLTTSGLHYTIQSISSSIYPRENRGLRDYGSKAEISISIFGYSLHCWSRRYIHS